MNIEERLIDDPELAGFYSGMAVIKTKAGGISGWKMVFRLFMRLAEYIDDFEEIGQIIAASPLLPKIGWDHERWLKHKEEIEREVIKKKPAKVWTHAEVEALTSDFETQLSRLRENHPAGQNSTEKDVDGSVQGVVNPNGENSAGKNPPHLGSTF